MTATPEQLEQKVALQRDQLAQTVEALSARLDVKQRAADRVSRTPKPVLLAPVLVGVVVFGLVVWRRTHQDP